MAKTVSILGCGWLGFPLAELLISKGFTVKGSTTHPEKRDQLRQAGLEPFVLGFTPHPQKEQLDDLPNFLKADVLVVAIPPQAGRQGDDFHPLQIMHLSEHLKLSTIDKIIYISSTSIYADENREITEEEPIIQGEANAALRRAEEILSGLHRKFIILRCGGLMGYDRIPGKYFIGKKEINTGSVPVNFVHRDDVIGIIYEVIRQEKWNEVFNVVAPEHPVRKDIYLKNAGEFGWEAPSFKEGEMPPYKVVNSNKVIKALQYSFQYPDPLQFQYELPQVRN
ncbi:NAD(P)H-binding protein [Rhodocytophaga rosea]|uniref:NAD(P)H-binding protein n=1 Tax=Rhodocytophaga rosea TaxID=2704465 RepID=A0A6C0GT00_9BACT|nr:NAD(P)H-binding protein [Rhodocytophaga rosea]QHT70600.1 NAD(P)H-binding protein [Rhodocytophaga rosea]